MPIPELHLRKAALYADMAAVDRELAAAHQQEANALRDAMQITTGEAGLVAAHAVEALRAEMLVEFAAQKKSRELFSESVIESILALHAKVDLLKERTV